MERRQGVQSELSDIIGGVVQQKFKKVLALDDMAAQVIDLQIVEIQKGLSQLCLLSPHRNLQIVEIQKGLSLFCFTKVQQIPDIECVFA